MIDEAKFPYKWMPKVIDFFIKNKESGKPFNSFKIAKSIGSCNPDAREVVKMIALLTSEGRIESANGQWKKISESPESEPVRTGFRMSYIKQMMEILKVLPEDFITLSDFVKKNNLDYQETESILLFLKDITKHGQVYLHKNRFPQKWLFKTWK